MVGAVSGELVVISGRYRGHRIPLSHDVFRIGRDRTCQIALDDEAASRVHSEIVRDGEKFLLRDLRSTNGTFLNDARISESALSNGDRIGIGDTVLLLQLEQRTDAQPQVVFAKEQPTASTNFSLSLGDTRFLELKEGTTIPDAQRQFTVLYEFMVDIAGILHMPAMLERALEHFFRAFGMDRGLVLLLTPEGEPGTKVTKVRDGLGDTGNILISRTMAQQLLQKKESFLSLNIAQDERFSASESLKGMHVCSIMGAPLKLKDKVFGMLYFDTARSNTQFSEQDLKLCTAMALQLAVCLENARLYSELLDASEFNNSVMRSLKSGIVVVDNTGRVLRINRATQEILRKTETNLLGRSLGDFIECAELNRMVQKTLTTGQAEDRAEVLVRLGSETVPLGLSTSVLTDHNGKVIGAVANFRNLSHVRKLEEQVRRSQSMAALGQMAAGVAHEIRNPLNSIRGFAQLLQEGAANNPKQSEYAQIVLEQVDRMNGIVQGLLDYSRQRELTLVPVHLEKLVEKLTQEMAADVAKARVRIELPRSESPMPAVLGNADKLRQVFQNILLNAVQASQPDSRIVVSFGLIQEAVPQEVKEKIGDTPPKRQVAIAFQDYGCGMDAAVMQKVFDPFFTKKDTGTGLGLSISQRIIDQHSGRIEVKSEAGKGSTFTVYLPAV